MGERGNPERVCFGTWKRFTGWDTDCRTMTFDDVTFMGTALWQPRTIIDYRNQDARAKGTLWLHPRPKVNGHQIDDVLRTCWPTPGEDRIQVKQRLFQILAIQRYAAESPFDICYEVYLT